VRGGKRRAREREKRKAGSRGEKRTGAEERELPSLVV
jgi:hypothetical protein